MFGAPNKAPFGPPFQPTTTTEREAPSWLDAARNTDNLIVSLRPPRLPTKTGGEPAGVVQAKVPRVPKPASANPEKETRTDAFEDLREPVSTRFETIAPKKKDTLIDELIPRADEEAVAAIHAAVSDLLDARRDALAHSERDLVKLVQAIARRVLARELSTDPTVVQKLVHEGLAALAATDFVTVRIGSFFNEVRDQIEDIVRRSGVRVQVLVDPAIGLYGCRIETEWGSVDESVDARLNTILEALSLVPPPPER